MSQDKAKKYDNLVWDNYQTGPQSDVISELYNVWRKLPASPLLGVISNTIQDLQALKELEENTILIGFVRKDISETLNKYSSSNISKTKTEIYTEPVYVRIA
jgi:hypothetical protein